MAEADQCQHRVEREDQRDEFASHVARSPGGRLASAACVQRVVTSAALVVATAHMNQVARIRLANRSVRPTVTAIGSHVARRRSGRGETRLAVTGRVATAATNMCHGGDIQRAHERFSSVAEMRNARRRIDAIQASLRGRNSRSILRAFECENIADGATSDSRLEPQYRVVFRPTVVVTPFVDHSF